MKLQTLLTKTLATLIFILLINTINAQQICVTIKGGPSNSVNADVLSSSPNQTNPSPDYFQAEQWTYGGTPGESRDLLKFDLSSIPAGSIITSAILNLYADTNSANGAMQGSADSSYLLQVTSTWNATTVTWNTQPTTTTAGEVFLPQSTSLNENYLNLNVETFVQSWVNTPSQNYGIMSKIITPNYYNHMIFCSGNYADSSLWPTLVICYTPAPTCVTIVGGPTNTTNADILSSSPNLTNPSLDYFQAEQWTYGGTPGESRDLLRFDLSGIPTGSVITSAHLNLYADTNSSNGAMSGNADATYLLQVTSSWTAASVTWNTQPSTTTTGEVLLPQSTSANENYLNLDVSTFVQSWVNNPSQNYGIMSKIITSNYYNHMIFCSGNFADSTLRPTLVICYLAPTCVTINGGPSNAVNADILSSSPNLTNPSSDYFQAEQWTYGGTPGESRDLLRFDLSGIPTGSIIHSATLNLYADTNSTNGAMQGSADSSYLLQVTSAWNAATVTWNTQPTTTTVGEVYLAQSTTLNENYLNLDVSTFVRSWVNNPSQNYGIMSKIITPNYYNHMIFCSGHYADSTLWPSLNICYSAPTGIIAVNPSDDNDMVVYPNPNNGQLFNIKVPASIDINRASVVVLDMLGREIPVTVLERQAGKFAVSIGSEALPGIYMVGLMSEDKQIYRKVLVSK